MHLYTLGTYFALTSKYCMNNELVAWKSGRIILQKLQIWQKISKKSTKW